MQERGGGGATRGLSVERTTTRGRDPGPPHPRQGRASSILGRAGWVSIKSQSQTGHWGPSAAVRSVGRWSSWELFPMGDCQH